MSGLEDRLLTLIKNLEEEKRLADKRAKQLYLATGGAIPVGGILPYLGGYFTDGVNGGFTMVMAGANTIVAVNTLLNPSGFYVCDGAALNLGGSPIFDGAGRYLPKLTDDRFIMGDTLGGTPGGDNAMAHTHVVGGLAIGNESAHTHSVTSNVAVAAHGITQPTFNGPSHRHTGPSHTHAAHLHISSSNYIRAAFVVTPAFTATRRLDFTVNNVSESATYGLPTTASGTGNTNYSGTGACTRSGDVGLSNNHNVTNNAVTSGAGEAHNHGISGNTGAASVTENRPKFLGCFYIMRAI